MPIQSSTYRSIVDEAITLEGADRTATIQVSRLLDELEASAGPEFVRDYIQSGKATRLKAAIEEAGIDVAPRKGGEKKAMSEAGGLFTPRGSAEVARPFSETAELQTEVRNLIRAGEAEKLF